MGAAEFIKVYRSKTNPGITKADEENRVNEWCVETHRTKLGVRSVIRCKGNTLAILTGEVNEAGERARYICHLHNMSLQKEGV